MLNSVERVAISATKPRLPATADESSSEISYELSSKYDVKAVYKVNNMTMTKKLK